MTQSLSSRALFRPAAGLIFLMCLTTAHVSARAQAVSSTAASPAPAYPATTAPNPPPAAALPPVSDHDRAEAEKHFKRGRKQFKKGDLDAAEQEYTEAARLNPGNAMYVAERELTRTKRVSELLAEASHARLSGDHAEVADALAKAGKLDPHNSLVAEQVRAEADAIEPIVLPGGDLSKIDSGVIELQPTPGKQPLHFKGMGQTLITQTFERFGIKATVDDSVANQMVRADTEDLNFQQSVDTAMLLTDSFYVPLDPHRVLVAKDTKANRVKFEREFVETLYLPGLTPTEMQDAFNVIRQLLNVTQATQNKDQGTLTLRAPEQTLKTANSILADLYQGHSQVLLTLTMYQVTRTREHTVGVELPNSFTLFNIPSEEASLYAQYGTIIQQLIAQGLINPNNPLEILAALIASGQLSNSVFSQGFFLFGGGKTLSGVGFGGGTANVQLNSTDVRQLDKVQLRVGNTETATFRYGTRYPIITSSYSSVTALPSTAGTNIAQLLAQYTGGTSGVTTTTPDVQYQDLGLTLKAAPMVQKSGDISLKLELTVSALAGASLNNVPVLANRELKTTVSLKEGEASMITSNMSRQETKSLIGIPGLNDIPGFPATNADNELNVSELVIVLTPHVVRLEHPNGMGKLIILPIH